MERKDCWTPSSASQFSSQLWVRMRKMKKTLLSLLGILKSTCCLWHRKMGKHLLGTEKRNVADGTLDEAVLQNSC